MQRIIEQIKYIEENISDYENSPTYKDLLDEYNNLKVLSYYERNMLNNIDKISSALSMIALHIQRANNKK
jgi:hypothetical protein